MKKDSTRNVNWTKSIVLRMSISLILVTTIILIVYAVFSYVSSKGELLSELEVISDRTAQRLATNLVEPLWNADEDVLNEIMNTEMIEKQLFGVQVFEGESTDVLKSKSRDLKWEVSEEKSVEFSGDMVLVEKEIVKEEEKTW